MYSDHCITQINSIHNQQDSEKDTKIHYNTKKANWTLFQNLTENLIPQNIKELSPITQCNQLEKAIDTAAQASIPTKKHNKHRAHPWWSEDCSQQIKLRNKARNKFYHQRTTNNFINYKKQQAITKRTIKQAKTTYWQDYCPFRRPRYA